mmetsp:Transcript_6747/g.15580  ORF Transcript_6747/g.15580 Transcript_6747/m.15580 type:complete len:206 (-) Transcript_6747:308-925(-)
MRKVATKTFLWPAPNIRKVGVFSCIIGISRLVRASSSSTSRCLEAQRFRCLPALPCGLACPDLPVALASPHLPAPPACPAVLELLAVPWVLESQRSPGDRWHRWHRSSPGHQERPEVHEILAVPCLLEDPGVPGDPGVPPLLQLQLRPQDPSLPSFPAVLWDRCLRDTHEGLARLGGQRGPWAPESRCLLEDQEGLGHLLGSRRF